MRHKRSSLLLCLSLLFFASSCSSPSSCDKSNGNGTSSPTCDRSAIEQEIQTYAEAYRKKDAQKVAAHWTENGQYISPQTRYRIAGRQKIEEQFEIMFAKTGSADLELHIDSLEFQEDGSAIERGTATVIIPGEPPSISSYTAIHVKEGGKWLLQSVTERDQQGETAPPQQLQELGWMIGKWIDESEGVKIETNSSWDLDNHFIKNEFTISIHNHKELSGLHYIGWDSKEQKIRSWVFDSKGSYGEGTWTRNGNQWIVHLTSTLPDGSKASAINVYKLIDANTFKFFSSGREVDGILLPNVKEVSIKRKKGTGTTKRQ